jgi:hypothetical protein
MTQVRVCIGIIDFSQSSCPLLPPVCTIIRAYKALSSRHDTDDPSVPEPLRPKPTRSAEPLFPMSTQPPAGHDPWDDVTRHRRDHHEPHQLSHTSPRPSWPTVMSPRSPSRAQQVDMSRTGPVMEDMQARADGAMHPTSTGNQAMGAAPPDEGPPPGYVEGPSGKQPEELGGM